MENQNLTSEYRIGDTVELNNEMFTYVGSRYDTVYKRTVYLYRPVNGKSKTLSPATKEESARLGIPSNYVVIVFKASVPKESISTPERKRSFTNKMFGWFLESNRWKHFLYAIPAGGDKLLARYRTGARNGIQRRAARREIRLGGCHVHGGRRICRGDVVLVAIGQLRITLPY